MGCLVAIDNFLWNVKIIPTRIELDWRSRKSVRDPEYLKKKREKEERKVKKAADKAQEKQDKETMKMAEEVVNQDRSELYSDSVKNSIITITKDDDSPIRRIRLINRACDTNKLIQFALFYMTDERGQLMNHKQVEKEIINGIAALFDFGKIYNDAGVSSLLMYDFNYKDDYLSTSKYLLSIDDIKSRERDSAFMEKLNKRKEHLYPNNEDNVEAKETEETRRTSWVADEHGFVHPIFITDNPIYLDEETYPVQGLGISDDLFKRLEIEFGEALTDKKYRYELNGDVVYLHLTKSPGITESFIIDTGNIMGLGRFGIIARISFGNDDIVVPAECKDIVKNVINNSFYVLTAEEIQRVLSYYFTNMGIYRYIDMSNTDKFVNLSKDELNVLENKLLFVIQKLAQLSPQSELPRLRFNKFESANNFELISDQFVRSPLGFRGDTSNIICDGLSFEITDNKVVQKFNGNTVAEFI